LVTEATATRRASRNSWNGARRCRRGIRRSTCARNGGTAIIVATGTTAGTMLENTGKSGKKRATNRKSTAKSSSGSTGKNTGTATTTTGTVTITGTATAPATATTTVCRPSIG